MEIKDHKETPLEIYLHGLKNCIKEAGLVYKERPNNPLSYVIYGDMPDRIKYRSIFGMRRNLAKIISHHNLTSKKPLELALLDIAGEKKLDELAETMERELGIGVVIYK